MKNRKNYILLFFLLLLFPATLVNAKSTPNADLTFLKGAKHQVYEKGSSFSISPKMAESRKKADRISESTKKEAINAIYKALLSFEKTVDLSTYRIPYSDSTASELLDGALERNQYLFNTLANYTDFSEESEFCSCYTSDKYIDSFEFQYNASASALQKQYRTLQKKVSSIQEKLDLKGCSKEQIVLAVHDYIALHTSYDTAKKPGRKSHTAYGSLVNGKAVCSGYATASKLLLEGYGIPVEIATSDAMDHAWSLVKLHGKWYHMDITWDDPYPKKKNYVNYWFFLKTDRELKKHPKANHYQWDSSGIRCTSKRYSNIPILNNNKLFHDRSYWYQQSSKKTSSGRYAYRKYNFTFTKSSVLVTSPLPFVKYRTRIYYAGKGNRILSMSPYGNSVRTVHRVSKHSSAKLVSFNIKNGKLLYSYRLHGKKKVGTKKLTSSTK